MSRTAAAVVATALVVITPLPTWAQTAAPSTPPTTGSCQFDEVLCAGLGSPRRAEPAPTAEAESGAAVPRRAGSSRPSPYRWERAPILGMRPLRPGELPSFRCIVAATAGPGTPYLERRIRVSTGEIAEQRIVCRPLPEQREPEPAPVRLPRNAVNQEELWQKIPLPEPAWGLNPGENGLAGLATWLWDPRGGASVTASVDLGGFTATATARPVRYEWKMWAASDGPNSNPSPVVVATVPGTEVEPAATYTYETKGDFSVTQTVTWAGTYSFTGPGVNDIVDLGTTTTTASMTYHVVEARGTRL